MAKRIRILSVSVLFGALAVTAGTASSAGALTYPTPNPNSSGLSELFQECQTADQEFCVELLEFTPTNGTKRQIADPVVPIEQRYTGTDPNISVFLQGSYSGPASVSMSNMVVLNVNFDQGMDTMQPYPPTGGTIKGLADGTFRFVIRTGDFDPSYMMLIGRYDAYTVTKGADGYFTVDVTVRPTPLAMVMGESANSRIAIDKCEANLWVKDCDSNFASRSQIMASFMMHPSAGDRDATRGMWLASNASTFQMGDMNVASGTIAVTAKGPHYVPADFGVPGLTQENGRELNPAYFEIGMPLTMIAKSLSAMTQTTVTVEQVKTFLADPSKLMTGTIKEAPAGAAAAVDKVQQLGVTVGDTSIRVNFNLTHFSAPNPTLKITNPATSGTTGSTTGGTTAAPARTAKTLKNGAKLSIATSAAKGKTLTAKSLLSPSAGAKVSSVVSRTKSVCTVKGTSVKMLKKGTCRLSATVKAKNKSSSVTFSVGVA